MARPLFTPEELAELARIDAELDAEPISSEEVAESNRRDRQAKRAIMDNKAAKIAESRRRHYEANKDRIAESKRRYREANKDKLAEYQRRYREANEGKAAEYQRRYRERRRNENAGIRNEDI